jgi:putative PEP-CTERM system TPR-repeat lipoprotein
MMRERPDDTRVYALAGVLQQSIGNSGRAEEYFLQAVELDSSNLSAQFGLAKLAIASGDDATAEKWINSVLDLSPAFMPGLIEAAKFFPTIGKQDELQRRVKAAIADDPKALAPRLLSGRIAIVEGRHADALASSRAALEDYPDDPRLMHTEGLALAGMGQIESGLNTISTAAKMDPTNETLLFDLARMNMSVKNYPAAADAAQQFYALRPESSKGLAILSESLAKSGRQDQARTVLSDYRARYPSQVLPLLLSGDVEMLDEQPRAALAYYESAAEISMSRSVVTRLVQAWRAIDPGEAAKPLEQWLEQHPDDAVMRRQYAQLLDALGDDAAAEEQYEAVLAQQENDAVALNNLAWKYADAGRPGALELAEKAHRLNPENGSISDTLGWMLFLDGEYGRALEKLRLAATQAPNNPEVKFHLVMVLVEVDQRTEARSMLDALLREHDEFPSREQAELLDNTL